MKVEDVGEFGLIDTIRTMIEKEQGRGRGVILSIGDDAAVVEPPSGLRQLLTTDTMVENVHFNQSYASGEEIGYKAMASNISDIAAMGGLPEYATVTVGLTRGTDLELIKDIYRGLLACAGEYGARIVGGDLTKSPRMFITIGLTGCVEPSRICSRAAAKPGDILLVTGSLGAAAASLRALKRGARPGRELPKAMAGRLTRPTPRIKEARTASLAGVKAMMDISDGLIADLSHLCQASGTDAKVRLDRVPVFPEAEHLPGLSKGSALKFALTGGEDYELIMSARPSLVNDIKAKVESDSGTPVTVIGDLVKGSGKVAVVDEKGAAVRQKRSGYDHFKTS